MKPSLGAFLDPSAPATIDVARLLETRMLIQANSGGGKSWVIRRLLEQTAGQVQQLVIDPEGEFSTLRERFDYVIAAPHDGDAIAHPRTAALLARRLLETGVSAILDIYDLKAYERQAFVKNFCEALVNAPKALWRPTLVVLDEAHIFCPEVGKSESAAAVIDLATRGRKRGFALIAATQRLAKLHKDTAAELLNKLIGRTGLDVDVKRAADELGMTPREAMAQLRGLDPGDFYAFGPALSQIVRSVRIGKVETTHPKAGDRALRAPPKPTAAIKAVLPKLADLPKEAETELRTAEDLRRALADTRRELTIARKAQPAAAPATSSRELVAAERRGFDSAATAADERLGQVIEDLRGAASAALATASASVLSQVFDRVKRPALRAPKVATIIPKNIPSPPGEIQPTKPWPRKSNGHAVDNGLSRPQQLILDRLAVLEERDIYPPARETLAAFCRVSPSSSGYEKNLSTLKTAGLIEYPRQGFVALSDAGRQVIEHVDDDGRPLSDFWLAILNPPKAKILSALVEAHPDPMTRDELAAAADQSETSSGYEKNLSALRTIGAIDYPERGQVALTPHVMPT